MILIPYPVDTWALIVTNKNTALLCSLVAFPPSPFVYIIPFNAFFTSRVASAVSPVSHFILSLNASLSRVFLLLACFGIALRRSGAFGVFGEEDSEEEEEELVALNDVSGAGAVR
jgi:hypothetical protein